MNDYEKIRLFESEVLDKVHLDFEFYKYSEDIVIPYLLQFYGDIERRRNDFLKSGFTEESFGFYLTNMMHGIGHCIRWIKQQTKPIYNDAGNHSPTYIHEITLDFVNWGMIYYSIAQEFTLWSRKIKEATIDDQIKTITFLHPDTYDYSKVHGLQLQYNNGLQEVYTRYPHEKMEDDFIEWVKDLDLTNPPIANSINWTKAKDSRSYPFLLSTIAEIIFPELPAETDFDGYNLQQLREFFTLLFLTFHFIRWTEGLLDEKYGMDHSFGSNPLYLSATQFRQLTAKTTGLSFGVVGSIIDDLTFDHKNFHSSITIQPFILSGSGVFYILPNVFTQLEPSRMIVGSLNKGTKKKVYDRLINQIENVSLKRIEAVITEGDRWKCHNTPTIKFAGKQYQPDLIIVSHSDRYVCVIDYKHFIGPITASEVEYRMSEMRKGITQVTNYKFVLSQLKRIGPEAIDGYNVFGILLTHKAMPIPVPLNLDIIITATDSFKTGVGNCHREQEGLDQLQTRLKSMEISTVVEGFSSIDDEIKVKDWKIIRKISKKKNQ